MRIYIAGWFGAQSRLRSIRDLVKDAGHEVVGTWLDEETDSSDDLKRREYAKRDLYEIGLAQLLLVDTFDPSSTGGREVELGYAMRSGIHTGIIGPKRNVFHHVTDRYFTGWDVALEWLRDPMVKLAQPRSRVRRKVKNPYDLSERGALVVSA